MSTEYPVQIDTTITLPSVADGITTVRAINVNALRDAILAVESELGVKPSSVYGTTRARLDVLETSINEFIDSSPGGNFTPISLSTGLITLNGKLIANAIPTTIVSNAGQGIIYFDTVAGKFLVSENGGAYITLAAGGGSFTGGGDLAGNGTSQTVIRIRGNAVKAGTLGASQDGYVFTWVNGNSDWEAKLIPTQTATGSAGGDLTNTYPNPTVAKLQGNAVANTTLGATQDGYILTWSNGSSNWQAKPVYTATGFVVTPTTISYLSTNVNEFIVVGTLSVPITITLKSSPSAGNQCIIKDANGSAFTNNITINGNGKNIDNASTYLLNSNYSSITLIYNGNIWSIV